MVEVSLNNYVHIHVLRQPVILYLAGWAAWQTKKLKNHSLSADNFT